MPEAPSDDQIVFMRNSERSTFRRCMLKWHWSYDMRLEPERQKGALTFGTLVHEALAGWYVPGVKRGVHPATTFEKLYVEQEHKFAQWDDDGEKYDALELGVSMLNGYVETYGKDDHIEIIQPELPISIDVYDRQGKYICTWVGRSDAAYKDRRKKRNNIGFLEHKTAKSIEEELRVNTGYGEQGLSYWWAGDLWFHHNGMLKKNQHIEHVMFNWLRKGLPDDRPVNAHGHRLNKPSKDALKAACREAGVGFTGTIDQLTSALRSAGWSEDRIAQLGEVSSRQPPPLYHRFPLEFGPSEMEDINRRIRAEAWLMREVRAGRAPMIKNPTKDCSWDCSFKEACELHGMGADYESILELEFTPSWDPYADHELVKEKS